MSSKTEICNLALQKLGATKIISLSEELTSGRKEAVECDLAYDPMRRAVIRANPWNCHQKRASLAASSTAPVWGFDNAYPLPTDCLRVNEVNVSRGVPWKVEAREIVADWEGELQILYNFDNEDATLFDDLFIEALSTRLAYQICEAITQSNTKKDALWSEYIDLTMPMAAKVDGQESGPEQIDEDDWIVARR